MKREVKPIDDSQLADMIQSPAFGEGSIRRSLYEVYQLRREVARLRTDIELLSMRLEELEGSGA